MREKQKAKQEADKKEDEEFQQATGIKNPLLPWDEAVERTHFELLRLKKQKEKMNQKDNEDADYSDLSVSESEFNDEE